MNKRITYLIVFIAPFVLFVPEIFTGRSIFWGLPILQFYPWRELAFTQILHGQLPLWNPYNGLGTPLFANYQSALAYPFTWIIFVFFIFGKLNGLIWGHLFVNILHLSLAGIGILKIGEEKGYSLQASVISALSFSFGGYLLARFGFFSMIWAAAWFPWVFYYSDRVWKSGAFSKNTIILSIVISLLLLSGHAQLSWYILMFCGINLLFKFRTPIKTWINPILQFVISSIMAAGIAAIQLVPTAELLFHSQRSAEVDTITSMTYSFWPWHFLNLLNPHIFGHPITGDYWGYGAYWEDAVYIGLLPILLGMTAIIMLLRKQKLAKWENIEIIFFVFMSLLGIILAMGSNTKIFPWIYQHIPTFDMFNAPARYMIWFVFSFSLLAGASFDLWRKPEKKTLYWVRLGTAGGFAIGLGALYMLFYGDSIKPTFIRATFEISILLTLVGIMYLLNPIRKSNVDIGKSGQIWKWIVVIFIAVDLFYMNINHTPVQKIATINDFVTSKENQDDIIYLPEYDDYEFRYHTTLNFDDFKNSILAKQLAKSNLANVNLFNKTVSLNNFEPMRLESYDNFIGILNKKNTEEQKSILSAYGINHYGVVDLDNPAMINYEKINAAQRIQFFTKAIQSDSTESMINALIKTPCVYIHTGTVEVLQNNDSECEIVDAEMANLVWQDNKISFNLDTPEDTWILISETYDFGWNLKIDGNNAKLYQANGFVMAFEVTGGDHSIELIYSPRSFIFGCLISLVSLILMCILVYRCRETQNRGVIHGD